MCSKKKRQFRSAYYRGDMDKVNELIRKHYWLAWYIPYRFQCPYERTGY